MVALGEKRRMKDWLREKNLGEEEKQQPGAPMVQVMLNFLT